jgi:hypothetical protein
MRKEITFSSAHKKRPFKVFYDSRQFKTRGISAVLKIIFHRHLVRLLINTNVSSFEKCSNLSSLFISANFYFLLI